MCKRKIACLTASVLLLLAGCSLPPHLSGYLYAFSEYDFTVTDLKSGQIIARVTVPHKDVPVADLNSRKNIRKVITYAEGAYFRYASKLDSHTILLSGRQGDWLYDRFTGALAPYPIPSRYSWLGMPVYLPNYKSVVAYSTDTKLLRIASDNPRDVVVIDDMGEGGYGYYAIVAISDDEVVYPADGDKVKYYNLGTGKVGYLPIKNCVPQLWRSKTQQLLCFAFYQKAHFYFIKLDGTQKKSAPNFDGMPAIYLPDYDTVLAGGSELLWHFPDPIPSEWSILRAYNLTSGSVHAFASGSWVYQGGTVWFPDVPKDIPGITFAGIKAGSRGQTR